MPTDFHDVFGAGRGVERPEDIAQRERLAIIAQLGTLSDRQRIVLDALCYRLGGAPMSAARLAQRTGSTPAGVTSTLRSLQERGLVYRRSLGDSRWEASADGRRLLDAHAD